MSEGDGRGRCITADPEQGKADSTSSSPLSSSQRDSLEWLWTGRKGSRCAGWIPALRQMPAPSAGGRADTAAPVGWGGGEKG
jgi:hypothetical protein